MKEVAFNLKHLRGLQAVAKTKNISEAASLVALSQPALTQALSKLESQLDQDLFVRSKNGVFLTPAGSVFLIRVEEALAELSEGVRKANRQAKRQGSKASDFQLRLTYTQLKALFAVSNAKNFSLAAKREGLSRPSINTAARDLEKVAGFEFYLKTQQGIELTPPAQLLAQHAGLMFKALQNGIEELEELVGRDARLISVGTVSFLDGTNIISDAVSRYLETYPKSTVRIHDGLYSHLLSRLRAGEIDYLLGAIREDLPFADVEQRLVIEDPLSVVAKCDHELAGKMNISWKEAPSFSWVLPRKGTPTRDFFEANLLAAGVPHVHIIESSSRAMLRGLLARSDRLAITSSQQIREEEELGLLTRLDFDLAGFGRRVGVTVRAPWKATNSQLQFLSMLEQ